MKAVLIAMIIILGYLMLLFATSGIALAFVAPSHPGSIIFPLQDFMEQRMRSFYTGSANQADYLLDLVERRINDLSIRAGSNYEVLCIEYLDKSFDQAIEVISFVKGEESERLQTRLLTLAHYAIDASDKLHQAPNEESDVFNKFQAKIQTLIHLTADRGELKNFRTLIPMVSAATSNHPRIDTKTIKPASGIIPFPQGSAGAMHEFYPLIGQHVLTSCVNCHNSGKYAGTPSQCISCHVLEQPVDHYLAECELCHSAISWTDIHFDHESASTETCETCHFTDKPENHYNGDCAACHITINWNDVTFDHDVANARDCLSCHGNEVPVNHYPGQCSNCHNTVNWASATFNHSGFTDCLACHNRDVPSNHYSGQCSNCHGTNGSWANAHFNHSGYSDCLACHNSNAPANHYPGQCSNCHSTNGWGGASFNHAGFTDCISCHEKDRPREHRSGQCSECHNTHRWEDGDDAVNPGINQNEALIPLDCSACHSSDIAVVPASIGQ